MIYFLSDLHGNRNFGGVDEYCKLAGTDDLLIILGDVGLNFENTENNRRFDSYFGSLRKNIAFIDGNHENFGYLNSFPEEQWNGGTIGRLTDNIVYLKRGNIYNIDGKSFFTFGGCKSSDKWKDMGLWYEGEEPADNELEFAYANLEKHGFAVDYILTHKYEQSPDRGTVSAKLKELTEFIEKNVKYKKWYAGHWHYDGRLDEKHTFIYDVLKTLE